jgi:hypothetical protein
MDLHAMEDVGICIPDSVENGQLLRIVMKYIRNHPEQSHKLSAMLVFNAEFYAFPCAAPAPRAKR